MSLWDKIKAEFDKLKADLTAAAPKADHSKTISDFQAKIDGFKAEIDAKDKTISDATATIADLNGKLAAKDKEIAALKATAKTAGEQAADLIAATGLNPEQAAAVAAKPQDAGGPKKPSLRAQWEALALKDSREAAKFFAEHSANPDFWK